ncbi:MAG: 4-hydroxy-tetrahydrodipicolinate reductase [Candidatus Hydrogenedentota bacterium]
MRVCINGICGRMGRRIAALILQNKELELTGGLEFKGNSEIGKDIGRLVGFDEIGIEVSDDAEKVVKKSDCVVDFSTKDATKELIEIIDRTNIKAVIGTTGLDNKFIDRLKKIGEKTAVVQSPNMSIGVNLLFKIAPEIAKILGKGFDIEIVEAHHKHKIDAPSGTAKKIAENIASTLGKNINDVVVYGRDGIVGERKDNEIGIFAVRGGDIVGEHTIIFAGIGERIELIHRAQSRDTFAIGAIKALLFLKDKTKGFYTMMDVLGIPK